MSHREVPRDEPKRRPGLAILYGRPDRLSTSYQTSQLARALEPWFALNHLRMRSQQTRGKGWQIERLWHNLLRPLAARPRSDYLLYTNDGIADIQPWRARKILYWYDAPWDYALDRPGPNRPVDWLRCRNVINADWVFAVSAAQVDLARRLRPERESSVHYLPVGVDARAFDPDKADREKAIQAYSLPRGGTVVGYLGFIGAWQGRFAAEPLIEAARRLPGDCRAHFLVVGSGAAAPLLRQAIAEAGLASRFTLTGYVEDAMLPHCLAAMDICVDTLEPGFHSLARSETKLKQYMAMGRACLATDIGENRVDLDQGECGLLVEPGSDALLAGILKLARNAALRGELGAKARTRAETVYDWQLLARKLATTVLMC